MVRLPCDCYACAATLIRFDSPRPSPSDKTQKAEGNRILARTKDDELMLSRTAQRLFRRRPQINHICINKTGCSALIVDNGGLCTNDGHSLERHAAGRTDALRLVTFQRCRRRFRSDIEHACYFSQLSADPRACALDPNAALHFFMHAVSLSIRVFGYRRSKVSD